MSYTDIFLKTPLRSMYRLGCLDGFLRFLAAYVLV